MLKTIYETGYDLHVANYVAYLHTDKNLYEDEEHKTNECQKSLYFVRRGSLRRRADF